MGKQEMEPLFYVTSQGMLPIDPELIRKYKLKKGTMTPFSRVRLADKHGDQTLEGMAQVPKENAGIHTAPEDGLVQLENGFNISQSEIIDFSQGTDSSSENS